MKSITMQTQSLTIVTWQKWILKMDSMVRTCSTRCSFSGTLLEICTCCWLVTAELVSRVLASRHHLQRLKTPFKSTKLYLNRRQVMSGLLLSTTNLWRQRRSIILLKFTTQTLSTKITLPRLILTTASQLKACAKKLSTFWKQSATSLCTSERLINQMLT